MAPPSFKRSFEPKRQEGWMNDPKQVEITEKLQTEMKAMFKPLDTRDLTPSEQKIVELQNENASLKIKIAELYSENDELAELVKLAAQRRRYEIPVKQMKGFLDFVNGQPSIYATFDSNTNVLEHLSID